MCETDIATYHCNATDRMCYNGGTCLYDEYYGYYCNCSYGTYGQFCEYSYGVTGREVFCVSFVSGFCLDTVKVGCYVPFNTLKVV